MSRVALPPLQLPDRDTDQHCEDRVTWRSPASYAPSPHNSDSHPSTGPPPTKPSALNSATSTRSDSDHSMSQLKQSLPSLSEALGVVDAPLPPPPCQPHPPSQAAPPSSTLPPPPPPELSPKHALRPSSRHQYRPYPCENAPPRHAGYTHDPREQRRYDGHYSHRAPSPPPQRHRMNGVRDVNDSQVYQPSIMHPPPGPPHHSPYHHDLDTRSEQCYQESINRHLEYFDFDRTLHEIAINSTKILDFGRACSSRLHQSPRTGFVSGPLPDTAEVDDLMERARATLFALTKTRNALVAQQQMQAQETRRDERPALDPRNPRIDGFDEPKGDSKKRKGRAAPPGRCHSCNRSDTPEWRRGPDGARTLCNACGLHYAKLTRKNDAVAAKHNGGGTTGSNLRTAESAK